MLPRGSRGARTWGPLRTQTIAPCLRYPPRCGNLRHWDRVSSPVGDAESTGDRRPRRRSAPELPRGLNRRRPRPPPAPSLRAPPRPSPAASRSRKTPSASGPPFLPAPGSPNPGPRRVPKLRRCLKVFSDGMAREGPRSDDLALATITSLVCLSARSRVR